jgi:hypothetical protein
VLATSAQAGPPFRTDDPEPVELGHYEINIFSIGVQAANSWITSLPTYELNYGAAPNLQLHILLPVDAANPARGTSGLGLGDLELGAKYRFVTPGDDDWFPQAGVFPQLELPTGNTKLGFATGNTQLFLPLWLQKDWGSWTAYGGGGYWINPGPGNRNYSFTGAALWRKITDSLNIGVELFHQTNAGRLSPESTGFNLGLTHDFSAQWHLLASAGEGVQNRTLTNQASYFLGIQITF